MNISKMITTSVLALSLFLTGCGKTEKVNKVDEKKDNETLTVFTTIYPLEDFTKKIGGSFVEVKSIYPLNFDAHSFEPSTKDMLNDLFINTGVGI